jgi:hypothetical protein
MELDEDREHQLDLLTAAIIGAVVGAGITLLFRQGPSGRRPIRPVLEMAGRGARVGGMAGLAGARWAGGRAAEGARWAAPYAERGWRSARDKGEELIDRIPIDEMAEQVRDYVDNAREAINEVVSDELKDLRKAVRRQRKKIGI